MKMFLANVEDNGTVRFGLIDEEFTEQTYGFIWSDKDSWTGMVVQKKNVRPCIGREECKMAADSAASYLQREIASLTARASRCKNDGERRKIEDMLAHCHSCQDFLNSLAK